MDPTMLLNPIGTAPRPDRNPEPLLLYCPHERRWYTGVWRDGAWRLQDHRERVLHPSHWLPGPEDFFGKIPEYLRRGTDARQKKYLEEICAIIAAIGNDLESSRLSDSARL